MVHKFVQNQELRNRLLATGDALLVHAYDRDKIFAAGMTGELLDKWAHEHAGSTLKIPNQLSTDTLVYFPQIGLGKNLLGLIAMRVREQIRRFLAASSGDASATSGDDQAGNMDPVIAAAMSGLDISDGPSASANESAQAEAKNDDDGKD